MFTIGIDIGGTTTRVGLVDGAGQPNVVQRFDTPRSGEALVEKLAARIRSIRESSAADQRAIDSAGLAVAGLVDSARGVVARAVNLPLLVDYPLADELSRRAHLSTTLHTDADATTWGEYSAQVQLGPSQAADRSLPPSQGGTKGGLCAAIEAFAHLRFGTGVACGVVSDGRLQPTGQPRTTHWPLLVVDQTDSALPCACGLRGCLETIASGPAIQQRALSLGLLLSSSTPAGEGVLAELQIRHARGEISVRDFIDQTAGAIVLAVSHLKSQISNLKSVCVGGGVIQALPCLFEQVAAQWSARQTAAFVEIRLARFGDNAGVVGAALLARGAGQRPATAERGDKAQR